MGFLLEKIVYNTTHALEHKVKHIEGKYSKEPYMCEKQNKALSKATVP